MWMPADKEIVKAINELALKLPHHVLNGMIFAIVTWQLGHIGRVIRFLYPLS
jgi:hypothetical protein